MVRGTRKVAIAVTILCLSAFPLAGCGVGRNGGADNNDGAGGGTVVTHQHGDGKGDHRRHSPQTFSAEEGQGQTRNAETGQAIVPVEQVAGASYVDAERMAGLIGFRAEWSQDKQELLIGDHDVVISIQSGSSAAVKEERSLSMEAPAIKRGEGMLVPAGAIKPLFEEEAVFTVDDAQVAIFPQPQREDPRPAGGKRFGDDPGDPAVRPDAEELPAWNGEPADQSLVPAIPALPADADASDLIADGRQFLGVEYEFGAAHYSTSKAFDCSSFVRYLFDQQGVDLPRTARAQAKLGSNVPRSKLRKGDLLFFYVPGRFKSDTKVGHVGIYMGNQKMLHSSPLPEDGVQITDINKEYWEDTFLFAKRLS